jgi:hypothetical protein
MDFTMNENFIYGKAQARVVRDPHVGREAAAPSIIR